MKKVLKITGIVSGIIIGILVVLILLINYFFFSMHQLPDGDFLTDERSPSGDYTVKAYVSRSGATVADAVRGEVVYHKKKDKTKNIYWEYRESEAVIQWLDEHTVSINGVKLDVRKDIYDFRKDKK
ncbi:DUF5412 family protein [Sporosarcina oncorhynchi]|uniref:DUF5412 family protein n=1 Tax=Sporosarcina oncorhynchi TaxID=3056444 RepID=A0ABZ0L6M4_9BACL|nr:DUF5412 family protein [Sporosarcina sp. T2O-4]WOV87221.1 DUF5412 family protein [Sporosarcina sp. T2O-4]